MKRCNVAVVGGLGLSLLLLGLLPGATAAQGYGDSGLVRTGLLLRQMDGVKRVLMIGAHPDDEDTAFLTTMARSWGAQTAYLSLTRGDGGQNLIGPELWEGLGVIRTGELESARRLDGGIQFFTRAFDFGYSKSADEALSLWPRDEVLADVVWVIRTFRPHVVVSVWSGTTRDGHGQHQASGILAQEAFAAAADPERFPEQLRRGAEVWAAPKLFQTVRRSMDEATVLLDAGSLDPLLGRSAYQLSMLSRSQHRSQDMGAPLPPGPRSAGALLVESRVGGSPENLFEGVDTTLTGVAGDLPAGVGQATVAHLEAYRDAVHRARTDFGLDRQVVVAPLREALEHLAAAAAGAWQDGDEEFRSVVQHKLDLTGEALLAAAGVVVDLRSDDDLVTPGQAVGLELQVWNGGEHALSDVAPALQIPDDWTSRLVTQEGLSPDGGVPPGTLATWTFEVSLPADAEPSRLYFLEEPRDGDMYRWPEDSDLWALPRNPAPVFGIVDFALGSGADAGTPVGVSLPWRYVGVDQARGEFYKPVLVVPEVSVHAAPSALVWPQVREEPATVNVTVRNDAPGTHAGEVRLEAPGDWTVEPDVQSFELDGGGAERSFTFQVRPAGVPSAGEHAIRAVVRTRDGARFAQGASLIDYDHIERAVMLHDAEARITVVPVRVADGLRVGYVMGTGDDGPEAIRQLGGEVELLDGAAVREGAFDGYDVVVLGVRAYETREDLRVANAQLLDYARNGGTVVVQYNQYQFSRGGYAPHALEIGRPAPRVADQTAPVTILEPEAPVFTTPNRITQDDFQGWAQERGLYFLSEWSDAFVPLLEMNDPGEPPRRGSLLVSQVGEGLYVYAALSFFRQFPSGVPGAYRLFANLISLSPRDWAAFMESRGGGMGGR